MNKMAKTDTYEQHGKREFQKTVFLFQEPSD